jgi:hypothetical protein
MEYYNASSKKKQLKMESWYHGWVMKFNMMGWTLWLLFAR